MHYRVYLVRRKNPFDLLAIRQIRLEENGKRRHGGAMSFLEIIQRNHAMSPGQQHFRTDTANVSGGAGNEDIQRNCSSI